MAAIQPRTFDSLHARLSSIRSLRKSTTYHPAGLPVLPVDTGPLAPVATGNVASLEMLLGIYPLIWRPRGPVDAVIRARRPGDQATRFFCRLSRIPSVRLPISSEPARAPAEASCARLAGRGPSFIMQRRPGLPGEVSGELEAQRIITARRRAASTPGGPGLISGASEAVVLVLGTKGDLALASGDCTAFACGGVLGHTRGEELHLKVCSPDIPKARSAQSRLPSSHGGGITGIMMNTFSCLSGSLRCFSLHEMHSAAPSMSPMLALHSTRYGAQYHGKRRRQAARSDARRCRAQARRYLPPIRLLRKL